MDYLFILLQWEKSECYIETLEEDKCVSPVFFFPFLQFRKKEKNMRSIFSFNREQKDQKKSNPNRKKLMWKHKFLLLLLNC